MGDGCASVRRSFDPTATARATATATRFDGRTDVKSWDKNILDASTARVGGRVGRVGACTRSRDRREVVTRGGGAFDSDPVRRTTTTTT